MNFNDMATLAVGSVVCGVVGWVPDTMRFSRDSKTSFGVMLVGMGLAAPFMLIIGFGLCGIVLGTFGLYRYFSSWLSFQAIEVIFGYICLNKQADQIYSEA